MKNIYQKITLACILATSIIILKTEPLLTAINNLNIDKTSSILKEKKELTQNYKAFLLNHIKDIREKYSSKKFIFSYKSLIQALMGGYLSFVGLININDQAEDFYLCFFDKIYFELIKDGLVTIVDDEDRNNKIQHMAFASHNIGNILSILTTSLETYCLYRAYKNSSTYSKYEAILAINTLIQDMPIQVS